MRAWAAWVGWCSLWLGACGGTDGPASAPPRDLFRDVPAVMPTLEPVMLTQYDPAVITGSPVGIAVTADGLIAMLDPDGPDDPVLLLIDAVSGATRQVIRRGMGPGELSGAGQVFAARDRIVILDFAKMALITVDAAGEVIDERPAPVHDARIVVFGGDSMDVVPLERPGTKGVFRREIAGGGERTLVDADEPFFASMREVVDRRSMPAFAARGEGFLVGDGLRYRLALYDAKGDTILTFGRELPPRLPTLREVELRTATLEGSAGPGMTRDAIQPEIEQFAATPLAHFEHPAAWIDDAGRVRVVGAVSDSAFIDVFAGTAYLGRATFSCPDFRRRIAQSDHWLVLLCAGADGGATDLKVWRVDAAAGDSAR